MRSSGFPKKKLIWLRQLSGDLRLPSPGTSRCPRRSQTGRRRGGDPRAAEAAGQGRSPTGSAQPRQTSGRQTLLPHPPLRPGVTNSRPLLAAGPGARVGRDLGRAPAQAAVGMSDGTLPRRANPAPPRPAPPRGYSPRGAPAPGAGRLRLAAAAGDRAWPRPAAGRCGRSLAAGGPVSGGGRGGGKWGREPRAAVSRREVAAAAAPSQEGTSGVPGPRRHRPPARPPGGTGRCRGKALRRGAGGERLLKINACCLRAEPGAAGVPSACLPPAGCLPCGVAASPAVPLGKGGALGWWNEGSGRQRAEPCPAAEAPAGRLRSRRPAPAGEPRRCIVLPRQIT